MTEVWKYKLEIVGRVQTLEVPVYSIVRHVHEQKGNLVVWIEIDKYQTTRQLLSFIVVGTGHSILPDFQVYIGTVHIGMFVWHVFMRGR